MFQRNDSIAAKLKVLPTDKITGRIEGHDKM